MSYEEYEVFEDEVITQTILVDAKSTIDFIKSKKRTFKSDFIFSSAGHDYNRHVGADFQNCVFEKDLIIDQSNFKYFVHFENCIFKNKFLVTKSSFEGGIKFINCHFEENDKVEGRRFEFQACTIDGNFRIEGNENEISNFGEILFIQNDEQNKSKIDSLWLINVNLPGVFIQSTTLDAVVIENSNVSVKSISESECRLIRNDNSRFSTFKIGDSEIKKIKSHVSHYGDFEILESEVHLFYIKEANFSKACKLFKINFKSNGEFENCSCSELMITNSSFAGSFSILEGTYGEAKIAACEFNYRLLFSPKDITKLILFHTEDLKGKLFFSDFLAKSILLEGSFDSSSIEFENITVNQFRLYGLNIQKAFMINDLNANQTLGHSLFLIDRSNLGSAILLNVALKNFDRVIIKNSILSDIQTVNVDWPDNLLVEEKKEKEEKEIYRKKRELYRQLKHNAEKQHNRIQALEFKRKEMQAYRKELPNPFMSGDAFILWLNNFANKHGLDWGRPLLLLFIFSVIIFILLNWVNACFNWESTVLKVSVYWQMLNPTHQLTRITGFELDETYAGMVHCLDFSHRLIVTFFIYEIVSAFRKFHK
jgi:hypothetical protein